MATTKPTKPSSTLPTTWGGTKTAYSAQRISSGYEANVEEVIDGGNLNYSLAGTFERLEYLTTIADVINATPVGKTVVVDSNNKYDYITPADDTNTVHKTGTESIAGDKTFSGDITFSNTITGNISGSAVKDGDGNEITLTYLKKDVSNADSTSKQTIVKWGIPDYTTGVSKTGNTDYTATEDCLIRIQCVEGTHADITMNINAIQAGTFGTYTGSAAKRSWSFFVAKGSSYKVSHSIGGNTPANLTIEVFKLFGE